MLAILESAFSRKLRAYVRLSESDLLVVSDLYRRRRNFPAGNDIVNQGEAHQRAFILAEGWACSYVLLPSGSRQIIDFQIPGDFLGLRSVLFRTSDHSIEPITPIEASEVVVSDLIDAFGRTPRLATAILWAASRDEAMVVEHLVGMGRRNATERVGHFLLELAARLRLVGLGSKTGYDCPLSQYQLADALGLSAVHVNRVLRDLREADLVTFQSGRVTFQNFDGLAEMADFDRSYLDQEGPLLR